jgi:hypothetical protein
VSACCVVFGGGDPFTRLLRDLLVGLWLLFIMCYPCTNALLNISLGPGPMFVFVFQLQVIVYLDCRRQPCMKDRR